MQGFAWLAYGKKPSNADMKAALVRAGVPFANVIVAIDCTLSNNDQRLHAPGGDTALNQYEEVMGLGLPLVMEQDMNGLMSMVGFGSEDAQDTSVFEFYTGEKTIAEARRAYRDKMKTVRLSGPTTFATSVEHAIAAHVKGTLTVLCIICDGTVSYACKHDTVKAIRRASHMAISIIIVGVGNADFTYMRALDDDLKKEGVLYDNVQFVALKDVPKSERYDRLAAELLSELPAQYKKMRELGYFSAVN